MTEKITLEELGVTDDPGTDWHPRADKPGARDADGNLKDLDDQQADEHRVKPERLGQIDAGRMLSAEDSDESPEGMV